MKDHSRFLRLSLPFSTIGTPHLQEATYPASNAKQTLHLPTSAAWRHRCFNLLTHAIQKNTNPYQKISYRQSLQPNPVTSLRG